MSVFDELRNKAKSLKDTVNQEIRSTVDANKGLIKDEQIKQFFAGQDANTKTIVPSYAVSTIIAKRKKNQPTNRVTLRDSGELYKSISVIAKKDTYEINTGVDYFKYLVTKYDQNELLGLQQQFKQDFTQRYIIPNISKRFREILS